MVMSEKVGYVVQFPPIPEDIKAKYSINGLFLRPFGIFREDLDIDFNQKSYPLLVTQILQCCTSDKNGNTPGQDFFSDLTVGKRIECLVTIAMLWDLSKLSVHLRCSNEMCQQPMELEISKKEIADLQLQSDKNDSFMIQIGDKSLPIRKPTGRDQIKWLKTPFINEDAAIKWMISSLLYENGKTDPFYDDEYSLSEECIKAIDRSMEEFDPLVNFNLMVICPNCEREGRYKINLEELSLVKLQEAQKSLLKIVHRLALHYHWSEDDIFSIPPWRRLHYLTLIEREEIR